MDFVKGFRLLFMDGRFNPKLSIVAFQILGFCINSALRGRIPVGRRLFFVFLLRSSTSALGTWPWHGARILKREPEFTSGFQLVFS